MPLLDTHLPHMPWGIQGHPRHPKAIPCSAPPTWRGWPLSDSVTPGCQFMSPQSRRFVWPTGCWNHLQGWWLHQAIFNPFNSRFHLDWDDWDYWDLKIWVNLVIQQTYVDHLVPLHTYTAYTCWQVRRWWSRVPQHVTSPQRQTWWVRGC